MACASLGEQVLPACRVRACRADWDRPLKVLWALPVAGHPARCSGAGESASEMLLLAVSEACTPSCAVRRVDRGLTWRAGSCGACCRARSQARAHRCGRWRRCARRRRLQRQPRGAGRRQRGGPRGRRRRTPGQRRPRAGRPCGRRPWARALRARRPWAGGGAGARRPVARGWRRRSARAGARGRLLRVPAGRHPRQARRGECFGLVLAASPCWRGGPVCQAQCCARPCMDPPVCDRRAWEVRPSP
jgi:hypothetical protein